MVDDEISRRDLFRNVGAAGVYAAALSTPDVASAQDVVADSQPENLTETMTSLARKRHMRPRQQKAFAIRALASLDGISGTTDPLPMPVGSDEELRPVHYAKALLRDVGPGKDPSLPNPKDFSQYRATLDQVYKNALAAVDSDPAADFASIEKLADLIGSPPDPTKKDLKFKFTNPLGGLSFDIEGLDPPYTNLGPPSVFDAKEQFKTAETAAQMAEVYWLALLREVPFSALDANVSEANLDSCLRRALADLNAFSWYQDGKGVGNIPLNRLFRIDMRTHRSQKLFGFDGVEVGPYLSQFLLVGTFEPKLQIEENQGIVSYGTLRLSQKQRTVLNKDFLFRPAPISNDGEFLAVQNGSRTAIGNDTPDPTLRFIRKIRDGANYVHFDEIYQEYLIAASILLSRIPRSGNTIISSTQGASTLAAEVATSAVSEFTGTPDMMLNAGNPYRNAKAQVGFATFGVTHILTLLAEVATRAHKAAWYHKWSLRWLRPEEFAARVHYKIVNNIDTYQIHDDLISSAKDKQPRTVLSAIREFNKDAGLSYLLPMAYPEGSPTHPARPSGHSTAAGASTTILKALFNGWFPLTSSDVPALNALVPNADGTALTSYGDQTPLSINGELNKLASNVSLFRMMGGVHWRGDSLSGLLLGEQIAVHLLIEQTQALRDQTGRVTTWFYREAWGRKPYFRIKLFRGDVIDVQDGRVYAVQEGVPRDIEDWQVSKRAMTFEEFVDEMY